jgi:exonuclease III
LDILCLQETHATTATIQERLDIQLHAKQSIWTQHCGIVSRNSSINFESLYVSPDHRTIVCQVSHNNNLFPTFTIMNIYAPASYKQRYTFYVQLIQLEYFQ